MTLKTVSTPTNTIDIDHLFATMESLKFGDLQRLHALALRATAIAQETGDYYRFTEALYYSAWAASRLRRLEEGLSTALEALRLAQRHGFSALEAAIVNVVGGMFADCMLWDEALKLYDYQVQLSQSLNNPKLEATAYNDKALVLFARKDYACSLNLLEMAARTMPQDASCAIELCITYANLGELHARTGSTDEGFRYAHLSIDLAHQNGQREMLALGLYTLACVYRMVGDVETARGHLAQVIHLDSVNHELMAQTELLYAECLQYEGRQQDAIDMLERLYVYLESNNLCAEAIHILEMLKASYEAIGDRRGIIEVYRRLTETTPRYRQRAGDMRLQVLSMLFTQDRSNLQAQVSRQKYEILQRVSHEFRTPLSVIRSSAEIIDSHGDGMPLDHRQNHLRTITHQVRSMTQTLENIAALVEDTLMLPSAEHLPLPLEGVTQAVLTRLNNDGLSAHRIHAEIIPPALAIPEVFHRAVDLVLYHLLNNALRYSSEAVLLEMCVNNGVLAITIEDSGVGIPKDEQGMVFEPLARGSNQLNTVGGGLGLAVVAKIVDELRGTVSLYSQVDQGTSITVHLPL